MHSSIAAEIKKYRENTLLYTNNSRAENRNDWEENVTWGHHTKLHMTHHGNGCFIETKE